MPSTRIKICGLTRPEDAQTATDSGADAVGLVFYAGSSRAVSIDQAEEIAAAVPPFVTVVALFVDEPETNIRRIIDRVPISLIQFHGEESPSFCEQFGRPWIKAVRVRPGLDITALSKRFRAARALLLDSWEEGVAGGTGKSFDWKLAPGNLPLPLVLAGGLHEANVGDAIKCLRPAAVDVSSGVESSPGIKDASRIRRFIEAVRATDRSLEGFANDE